MLKLVSSASEIYGEEERQHIASILVNDLTVQQPLNQIKQIWIAMTFKPAGFKTKSYNNQFKDFLIDESESPGKTRQSKSPKK